MNVNGIIILDLFIFYKNWVDECDGMKSWLFVYLSDIIEYVGVCDINFNIIKFF